MARKSVFYMGNACSLRNDPNDLKMTAYTFTLMILLACTAATYSRLDRTHGGSFAAVLYFYAAIYIEQHVRCKILMCEGAQVTERIAMG